MSTHNSIPPQAPVPPRDEESVPASKDEQQDETISPYLVDWDDDDEENPLNWSTAYKCWITFQLGMLALAASLGSSIIAPAEPDIAAHFGMSKEVTVLCVSLYMWVIRCALSCSWLTDNPHQPGLRIGSDVLGSRLGDMGT